MGKFLLCLILNTFVFVLLCLVAGCGGGGNSSTVPSDPLNNWHWRNPLPQGNPLNGVTYGNGAFIAVGAGGTILTSADGITWTSNTSGTAKSLNGVTYGELPVKLLA